MTTKGQVGELIKAAEFALKAFSQEWFILNPNIDSEDEEPASRVYEKLRVAVEKIKKGGIKL